ncbi:hypothetical protein E3E23_06980 [Thermococcus sp. CX2]|uniref:hypothetical protein n=1 Tax=Thermococcus sp. CX2 TaxID=163006 RepID=UPI00143A5651|nr:hypothetical protein [Thermococcus sp. CX2]NJE85566.1 hypothetical protein [Thermococcus sp. CX2]
MKLGVKELDNVLGDIEKGSLILFHEADSRSRGKEIVFKIISSKLDSDNLVGLFNISYPIPVLLSILERNGVSATKHLNEDRLVIIDTFGSIYGMRYNIKNVWYLNGPISLETLGQKYIDVIRRYKQYWAEKGMFDGRELWGSSIVMSEYKHIFGVDATLRYLEVSSEIRRRSDVYRKYPSGTNIWLYSGVDNKVLPFLYRKAKYIIKTESYIEGWEVKRRLKILKAPGLEDTVEFEYEITKSGLKLREL